MVLAWRKVVAAPYDQSTQAFRNSHLSSSDITATSLLNVNPVSHSLPIGYKDPPTLSPTKLRRLIISQTTARCSRGCYSVKSTPYYRAGCYGDSGPQPIVNFGAQSGWVEAATAASFIADNNGRGKSHPALNFWAEGGCKGQRTVIKQFRDGQCFPKPLRAKSAKIISA